MSTVSIEPSALARFIDLLPSILSQTRHQELWGVDLQHAEPQILARILQKFLNIHSAIPPLQLPRASSSLAAALRWRRYRDLRAVHQSLATSKGIVNLGHAVMEKLCSLLLDQADNLDPDGYSASCVVEFRIRDTVKSGTAHQRFQTKVGNAIEELASDIRTRYPGIFHKAFIIDPNYDYLASLDIHDRLLENTLLLQNPEDLASHLGSQISAYYGGFGKPLVESDCLRRCDLVGQDAETGLEIQEGSSSGNFPLPVAQGEVQNSNAGTSLEPSVTSEPKEQELRLIYSETIGPPSLFPDKMGADLVFADSDTIVKFGPDVRLAEAEALHLVSSRTSIAVPKLISAYILDGVGYIIMTYEEGEPFQDYWDRVSEADRTLLLHQLQGYVTEMQSIEGNFIGGLDESPCLDGIFEAGYGDYTRYSYGPYPSEESFNEGIVQALRDRLPPDVLRENDMESTFFKGEYMLYQTVRGLKGHIIVFTHGDLHPGNILARADGTAVLVDWGLAGFWSEYWDSIVR
ncbi:kinase-like domain-containing protein [Aspergillus californicus]